MEQGVGVHGGGGGVESKGGVIESDDVFDLPVVRGDDEQIAPTVCNGFLEGSYVRRGNPETLAVGVQSRERPRSFSGEVRRGFGGGHIVSPG